MNATMQVKAFIDQEAIEAYCGAIDEPDHIFGLTFEETVTRAK